jgi:hypothetical protein
MNLTADVLELGAGRREALRDVAASRDRRYRLEVRRDVSAGLDCGLDVALGDKGRRERRRRCNERELRELHPTPSRAILLAWGPRKEQGARLVSSQTDRRLAKGEPVNPMFDNADQCFEPVSQEAPRSTAR